jgi:C_GCAxxG_C_C family probable redox protein
LQGLQAALGLEGEAFWQAVTGFGGGLGRRQLVCGAVTGGIVACGLAVARRRGSDREDRKGLRGETYAMVQRFLREFETRFGVLDCRTLTGFDFSVPEGHDRFAEAGGRERVCRPAVRFAVETVTRLCG